MEKNRPSPESYALDSAGNALRVVSLLRTKRTLTVTEVSKELGVAKSTAHRILTSLVAESFALRDPVRRRYHPGRALVETGLTALGRVPGADPTSRPMLQKLAERTQGSVKILVLDGPFVRVIQSADAHPNRRVGGEIGSLRPAHMTAGGKMLLAGEPIEDIQTRITPVLPALNTDDDHTGLENLYSELAAISERGWAANLNEATEGVSGIAVPILDSNGRTLSSLVVAFPTDDLSPDQHVTMLIPMFECAHHLATATDLEWHTQASRTARQLP